MTDHVATWLQSQNEPMRRFLEETVNLSSHTLDIPGVSAVQTRFEQELRRCGLATTRVPSSDHNGIRYADHVLARTEAADTAKYVILSGHVDTVHQQKDGFLRYQHDSHNENRAIGPGVYDMKGGDVVMLWAIKVLAKMDRLRRIPITVILNSEEELGCPDSRDLFRREAANAWAALVFESGRMEDIIVVRRKAWVKYRIRSTGRSAHAGTSLWQGRSAIQQLACLVPKLNSLADRNQQITANVGTFVGGTQTNVVPDVAVMEFEMRAPSDPLLASCEDQFRQICQETHVDGAETAVEEICRAPAMLPVEGMEELCKSYIRSGKAAGLSFRREEHVIGGFSNANFLASAGVPTLDALGVNGGKAHSSDEFMLINSLLPRTITLARWLLDVAGRQ